MLDLLSLCIVVSTTLATGILITISLIGSGVIAAVLWFVGLS